MAFSTLSKYLVLFIICISSCFSCDKSEESSLTESCFFFDQRQCAGDEWAGLISEKDSWEEREIAMKTYLQSKDIIVIDLYIDSLFHEGVCEACYVCPEQHRIFVKIEESNMSILKDLDLLNFGSGFCELLFN
jgi:hypothetical protein